MSETVIYNPKKKMDLTFMKQSSMLDKALVNINGSVHEGTIELINFNGINVNLGHGGRFYKWCHVIAIKKQS